MFLWDRNGLPWFTFRCHLPINGLSVLARLINELDWCDERGIIHCIAMRTNPTDDARCKALLLLSTDWLLCTAATESVDYDCELKEGVSSRAEFFSPRQWSISFLTCHCLWEGPAWHETENCIPNRFELVSNRVKFECIVSATDRRRSELSKTSLEVSGKRRALSICQER